MLAAKTIKSFFIAVILLTVSISSPLFSNALALSYAAPVKFSSPLLQYPDSMVLDEVTSGQQLIIATTVSHVSGNQDLDMIVLFEVRNSAGVTEYLAWQSLVLKAGSQTQVGVSWMPTHGGAYEIRTFAITNDWENPQVVATVESYAFDIRHACGGNAACITGTITNVIDGDTLDLGETRIRLALVNTPERGELDYFAAKQQTERLCPVGSEAIIDEDDGQTEGSFGRMIAKVYCADGAIVLNEELLRGNFGEILAKFCDVSEFGREVWARQHGCIS
jgi:hypothetical protein